MPSAKSLLKSMLITVATLYVVNHIEPIKDAVEGGSSWF